MLLSLEVLSCTDLRGIRRMLDYTKDLKKEEENEIIQDSAVLRIGRE